MSGAAIAAAAGDLVTISDGIATVVVAPAIGGAIAAFRWQGADGPIDWLRPATTAALAGRDAGEMACFPLAPYSNRIRESRFSFAGRDIDLMGRRPEDPHFEHGHAWRHPWSVASRAADAVVIRYVHEADAWPWRFAVEQRIAVAEGALGVRIELRNLDATPMPGGLGLHPFFPATPRTRLEARVQGMWRTDAEVLPTVHGDVPTDADPNAGLVVSEAELDTVFTGWSRSATLSWPEEGRALSLQAEAPLDKLVLYTPAGAGYFCAEPVSNVTDAFNLAALGTPGTGRFVLDPGAAMAAVVRFSPSIRAPGRADQGVGGPGPG